MELQANSSRESQSIGSCDGACGIGGEGGLKYKVYLTVASAALP